MKQLLYLIGVPGSGKTTLTNATFAGTDPVLRTDAPVPHMEYAPGRVQLGLPREGHGGTDALSMSIAPKVVEQLREGDWEYVFAEGDRLASESFFRQAIEAGWDLRVVWLLTDLGEAARRRQERGSTQNEGWIKGRTTKVYNLGRRYAAVTLDGSLPMDSLVRMLQMEKVIQELRVNAPNER